MGVVYLVVLDYLLSVMTKKGHQLYWRKTAPPDKSWLCLGYTQMPVRVNHPHSLPCIYP